MTGTVRACTLVGECLRVTLDLPASSAVPAAAVTADLADAFGQALHAVEVVRDAAGNGAVRIEARVPGLDPEADPPAFLLTVEAGGPPERFWVAPVRGPLRVTEAGPAPAPPPGGIAIDYTARDYAPLCAMMKARIAEHVGGDAVGILDHPADPLATLIEALAYVGDQFAFRQDAAGTEAYLPTARSRLSLRRHARLRGYAPDDGCAARTLLAFTVSGEGVIPAGLAAVTAQPGRSVTVLDPGPLARSTTAFETVQALRVAPALNDLGAALARPAPYTLEAGACGAVLSGDWTGAGPNPLAPGRLLVLRQAVDPDGAAAFGAQALRLLAIEPAGDGADATRLRWHPEDALARPLTVPPPGQAGAVALLGNVVLADHGLILPAAPALDPPTVPDSGTYRPHLAIDDPVYVYPAPEDVLNGSPDPVTAALLLSSARAALTPDPREAVAAVRLLERPGPDSDGAPVRIWRAVRDLLAAPAAARLFGLAPECAPQDGPGRLVLAFGDGTFGRRPAPGTAFTVLVRSGGGVDGQVEAGALAQVIGPAPLVLSVTNPLPGRPTDPESDAAIRLLAATAHRAQERGITAEDWQRLGRRDPLVAVVTAEEGPDGGGPCTIGLEVATPDPAGFALARARLLDLAVLGAPPAIHPIENAFLDAALVAYGRPGADIRAARARLARAFGPGRLPDGGPAFLDPALWPPGRDAVLADFVAVLAADPAVAAIVTDPAADPRLRFRLVDGPDALASGRIVLGPARRLRAENDPLRPEAGRLVLYLAAAP